MGFVDVLIGELVEEEAFAGGIFLGTCKDSRLKIITNWAKGTLFGCYVSAADIFSCVVAWHYTAGNNLRNESSLALERD
jgi:hypothetical protein